VIGQLPPFALTTPSFRFRALASRAGRASLGGDREVALACFVSARLIAGLIAPYSIVPGDAATRAAGARVWLASQSLPVQTRTGVVAAIAAVASSNRRAASKALRMLIDAGKTQLDPASLAELTELARDIGPQINQA
jgi:hypothetical protein